jgi:chromate reductase, NAD(P)H dehydrogenase (quinone)
MLHVLGIAGSLSKRSFNRALLRAAAGLAPDGIEVEIFELAGVPPYDADLDESLDGGPFPERVRELHDAVVAADAVLLAVPEYNWGPSGVMKNAIDWVSLPTGPSPLAEKPVALIGTSPGPAGTGRAQLQLRQNLLATNSFVLQSPVVQLGGARERFDGDGHLVDEDARELLAGTLRALRDWAVRHRPAAAVEA